MLGGRAYFGPVFWAQIFSAGWARPVPPTVATTLIITMITIILTIIHLTQSVHFQTYGTLCHTCQKYKYSRSKFSVALDIRCASGNSSSEEFSSHEECTDAAVDKIVEVVTSHNFCKHVHVLSCIPRMKCLPQIYS